MFSDRLNEKGIGIFVVIGLGFLFFLILPTILFTISGISKIMFQVIMAFMIIAYVKQFGLEGGLMWIIAGILIYFLIWKYIYLTATLYMLMILMGMGFTSAIIWGSASIRGIIEKRKMRE